MGMYQGLLGSGKEHMILQITMENDSPCPKY
jgi:hypothetical protein